MVRCFFRCTRLKFHCSDDASWDDGSVCPHDYLSCAAARCDMKPHFLEACFYRCPDGYAATPGRAGSPSTAPARGTWDKRHGYTDADCDVFPCWFHVTNESDVKCPLCGGQSTVEAECATPTHRHREGGKNRGLPTHRHRGRKEWMREVRCQPTPRWPPRGAHRQGNEGTYIGERRLGLDQSTSIRWLTWTRLHVRCANVEPRHRK